MAKKKNLLQSMEEDRRNRRTFRQAMAKELREHKTHHQQPPSEPGGF